MFSGFYAIYYTGRESSGQFSMLVQGDRVVGLEAAGGIVRGICKSGENGAAFFALTFNFAKGTELVTGQKLEQDLSVPFEISVEANTFSGAHQRAEFPTGPVNFRIEKLADL